MGGTLDPEKVKGKILACLRGETARVDKGEQAALAGAVGMILCNDKFDGNDTVADPHVLPASHIGYEDGVAVFAYINSTELSLFVFAYINSIYVFSLSLSLSSRRIFFFSLIYQD
jgi:hypothetical protein